MSAAAPNPLQALLAAHGAPGGAPAGPPNGQHTIQVNPQGGPPPAALLGALASRGSAGGGGSSNVTVSSVISDLHTLAGKVDDPQDKQTVLKCLAAIQGIQVKEQKENESAMGTTPAHKALARATRGGSGY